MYTSLYASPTLPWVVYTSLYASPPSLPGYTTLPARYTPCTEHRYGGVRVCALRRADLLGSVLRLVLGQAPVSAKSVKSVTDDRRARARARAHARTKDQMIG